MFYKNKNLLLVVFIFKFINSAVSTPAFNYDASLEAYRTNARALNARIKGLNLFLEQDVASVLRDEDTFKNLQNSGITQESLDKQISLLKKPDTLPTGSFVLPEKFAKSLAESLPKELQNYNWDKTSLFTDLPDFITNLVITEEKGLSKDIIKKAFSVKGMFLEPIKSARIRKEVNNLLKEKFIKLQEYQKNNAKFQQQKTLESKLFNPLDGTFKELQEYQEKLQDFEAKFDEAISETQTFKDNAQAEYNKLVSNDQVYQRSRQRGTEFDIKILKEIKSRFKDILKFPGITDEELQKALNKFLQDNSTFTPKTFYEALNKNSLFRDVNQANRVKSIKDHFTKFITANDHLAKATDALAFLKEDQQTFLEKNIKDKILIIKYQAKPAEPVSAPKPAEPVSAPKPEGLRIIVNPFGKNKERGVLTRSSTLDQQTLNKQLEAQRSLDLAIKAAEKAAAVLKETEEEAAIKAAALEEALKEAAESDAANQEKAAERLAQANQDHQEAQARLAQVKEHQKEQEELTKQAILKAQARLTEEALQGIEDK